MQSKPLLHDMLKDALKENSYSCDIQVLQYMYELVPVFVYGTEKSFCHEHDVIRQYKPAGYGYTDRPSFIMRVHKEHKFPIVSYDPAHPASSRVYGEVYMLPPSALMYLDAFHQNGMYTNRGWRGIQAYGAEGIGNTEKMYSGIEALMYTTRPFGIKLEEYREKTPVNSPQPYYLWGRADDDECKKPGTLLRM